MDATDERKTEVMPEKKAEPGKRTAYPAGIDLAPLPADPAYLSMDTGPPYRARYDKNILPADYFEPGVVGFFVPEHGRDRAINRLPDERMPYMGIEAVERHEGWHFHIHRAGGVHDERGINNRVKDEMKLYTFPFSSY